VGLGAEPVGIQIFNRNQTAEHSEKRVLLWPQLETALKLPTATPSRKVKPNVMTLPQIFMTCEAVKRQSSGTATGGQTLAATMMFKFHGSVKTGKRVAVACDFVRSTTHKPIFLVGWFGFWSE
jgi:hypothetical protein